MISWKWFKQIVDFRKIYPQYIETDGIYSLKLYDGPALIEECVLYKSVNIEDIADFEQNYKALSNTSSPKEVITASEKSDKEMKACRMTALVDSNTKLATCLLKIPGTMATGDGRYISGGTCFFDSPVAGDYVSDISIIDVDNKLGHGANFVIKKMADDGLSSDNVGFFIPPIRGDMQFDILGSPPFIPAELYLRFIGKKAGDLSVLGAVNFYVNIRWSKLV